MKQNNRGQMSPPSVIPVVALVVVSVVAMNVMSTFKQQVNPEDIDTVCMGVFGCGGPSMDGAGILIAALIPALVLFRWLVLPPDTMHPGSGDGQTRVQLVKEQYVEGDIDSVVALEDQLEDVIDDTQDGGEE